MSILPDEFVELMTKKRELESKIAAAITEFEQHFGNAIVVGNVDMLKVDTLAGNSSVVTVSLEIA